VHPRERERRVTVVGCRARAWDAYQGRDALDALRMAADDHVVTETKDVRRVGKIKVVECRRHLDLRCELHNSYFTAVLTFSKTLLLQCRIRTATSTHQLGAVTHDDHVDELRRVRGQDKARRVEQGELLHRRVVRRRRHHVDVLDAHAVQQRLHLGVVENATPGTQRTAQL